MNDRSNGDRTETEERVAENSTPAPRVAPAHDPDTPVDPATGLRVGMHDDDRSPLDPGMPRDPTGGSLDRK